MAGMGGGREITLESTYDPTLDEGAPQQAKSDPEVLRKALELLNKGPSKPASGGPARAPIPLLRGTPLDATPKDEGTPTDVPGTVVDSGAADYLEQPIRGPLAETGPGRAMNRGASIMNSTLGMVTDLPKALERAQDPEKMREILRGTGAAAGGMGGFASPMPGGTMLGTALGSMAGNYVADVYKSYYDAAKANGESPAIMSSHLRHLKEAMTDAAVTGGTQVVLPVILAGPKAILSKLLRLPPNSTELLKEASDIGVEIGAANMPGTRAATAVKVLGRMPIVGGSAQNAARLQAKQLLAGQNDLFGQVAAPKAMTEVSQEAADAGLAKFNEFATKIQRQAEHALRVGEAAGEIIPYNAVKTQAQATLDKLNLLPGGAKTFLDVKSINFLESMAKLPDNVSTPAIKTIDATLENMIRKTMNSTNIATPELAQLRILNDRALDGVDHPAAKLMAKANQDLQTGLTTYANDVAKTVGKLERNVYGIGRIQPGTKTPEEMVDTVTKLRSTREVQQMRDIVGDDSIKQIARTKLDMAWNNAVVSKEDQPFKWSADKFAAELGLNDPGGKQYAVTQELLRGTGVQMDKLKDLAGVAESVASAPVADVSTFMARAAMLRGAGGITEALKGALTLGLTKAGADKAGLITTLSGLGLVRMGVGALMKPGLVEAATLSLDRTAAQGARIAALEHLFTQIPEAFEDAIDKYMPADVQRGVQNAAGPR
jgi:hypothetical protein